MPLASFSQRKATLGLLGIIAIATTVHIIGLPILGAWALRSSFEIIVIGSYLLCIMMLRGQHRQTGDHTALVVTLLFGLLYVTGNAHAQTTTTSGGIGDITTVATPVLTLINQIAGYVMLITYPLAMIAGCFVGYRMFFQGRVPATQMYMLVGGLVFVALCGTAAKVLTNNQITTASTSGTLS